MIPSLLVTGTRLESLPPVLFLDVDGVLNSAAYMKAGHMRRDDDRDFFDPAPCALLDFVLRAAGAVIVVSSSWRIQRSPALMQSLLRECGAPAATVIGETPHWVTRPSGAIVTAYDRRGSEIQAWLDANPPPRSWAIVDDSDDMGPLSHRLVLTSWATGMQREHADRLIDLLSEAPPAHPVEVDR